MPLMLLVEGSDDLHVIKNLLRARGIEIDERKEIRDCRGVSTLLDDDLPVILKSGYTAIGIVVDANSDPAARWQSIHDRLRNVGYDVPGTPDTNGTIIRAGETIGVWLMPSNDSTGSLEHFVERLIHADDSELWAAACEAVTRLPENMRRCSATLKSQLHTFLAWQEEPGTPLGAAITKKYFDAHASAAAAAFVSWFQQLRNAQ